MAETVEQINAEFMALPEDKRTERIAQLTEDQLRELVIFRICDLMDTMDEIAETGKVPARWSEKGAT